ncbi:MAG: FkbM family methyltransferase [Chitinophagaceae bacterium]|nr:FkbM family methyltransferase [Chitinophagaceae bacterium]
MWNFRRALAGGRKAIYRWQHPFNFGRMVSSGLGKYRLLIGQVSNWPSYFWFKTFGKGRVAHFRLRKSQVQVSVPFALLRVFKEVFMKDGYRYKWVAHQLNHGAAVVDIGANIGLFAAWIAEHFPACSVLAVEPLPLNAGIMRQNLRAFSQVTCIEAAVTSTSRVPISFFSNDNGEFTDSATTIEGLFDNRHRTTVPAIPLADVMAQVEGPIGILKIDCEGSEYDILFNSDPTLFDRVQCIVVETHDLGTPGHNTAAVQQFLKDQGFELSTHAVGAGLDIIWANRPA